jgi:hypothetical protein
MFEIRQRGIGRADSPAEDDYGTWRMRGNTCSYALKEEQLHISRKLMFEYVLSRGASM